MILNMTYYYPIVIPIGGGGIGLSPDNNPALFWTVVGILAALSVAGVASLTWVIIMVIIELRK